MLIQSLDSNNGTVVLFYRDFKVMIGLPAIEIMLFCDFAIIKPSLPDCDILLE
jgi:ATP-dependent RNA circularization protein (DNA/RNA ligase family)